MRFDAVVLCGGSARRLDGADKGAIRVGGRSLLARTLDAVASGQTVVVVGPPRESDTEVVWVQEDPPGGGPVGAIFAGLAATTEPVVFVLGVDFPFVDRACVLRIVGELGDEDGVILADREGSRQPLIGAYRRAALQDALNGRNPADMAVRVLVAGLDLKILVDPLATRDCDTWEEVSEIDRLMS